MGVDATDDDPARPAIFVSLGAIGPLPARYPLVPTA
ncbi:hypothetical protein CGMCC3_g852 [Colletotrichum fructicola]|nr:uncharacterized protein CGMCC3_g852 [Colletotrichum fructicola]KAE9583197.1 hypothetical protein CGMCC3_g852 [Colletotrichum fructicola]